MLFKLMQSKITIPRQIDRYRIGNSSRWTRFENTCCQCSGYCTRAFGLSCPYSWHSIYPTQSQEIFETSDHPRENYAIPCGYKDVVRRKIVRNIGNFKRFILAYIRVYTMFFYIIFSSCQILGYFEACGFLALYRQWIVCGVARKHTGRLGVFERFIESEVVCAIDLDKLCAILQNLDSLCDRSRLWNIDFYRYARCGSNAGHARCGISGRSKDNFLYAEFTRKGCHKPACSVLIRARGITGIILEVEIWHFKLSP